MAAEVRPAEPLPAGPGVLPPAAVYLREGGGQPRGRARRVRRRHAERAAEDVWTLRRACPSSSGARLHVVEVATGKAIALGAEGSTSFAPAWSPDGTRLAYYSDEGGSLRAWVFDAGQGQVGRRRRTCGSRSTSTRRRSCPRRGAPTAGTCWSPPCRRTSRTPTRGRPGRAHDRERAAGPGAGRPRPVERCRAGPARRGPGGDVQPLRFARRPDGHRQSATAPPRVLLPARPPGRSGPAFARYSPTGRFLAYVSCMRPGPTPEAEDVLDLGVVKVGEAEPLLVEEISRLYEGRESYSGDHLGRAGVILAWHPTEDVLLFLNGNRLRRLDCRGAAKPRADTPAPGTGGGSTAITSPSPGTGTRRSSACCPRTRPPTAPRSPPSASSRSTAARPGSSPCPRGSTAARSSAATASRSGSPSPTRRRSSPATRTGRGPWSAASTWAAAVGRRVRSEPGTVEFHGMPRDGSFLVGTVQGYARPPDFYRLGVDFSAGRPPGGDRAAARRPGDRDRRDVRDRGPAPRRGA